MQKTQVVRRELAGAYGYTTRSIAASLATASNRIYKVPRAAGASGKSPLSTPRAHSGVRSAR